MEEEIKDDEELGDYDLSKYLDEEDKNREGMCQVGRMNVSNGIRAGKVRIDVR